MSYSDALLAQLNTTMLVKLKDLSDAEVTRFRTEIMKATILYPTDSTRVEETYANWADNQQRVSDLLNKVIESRLEEEREHTEQMMSRGAMLATKGN